MHSSYMTAIFSLNFKALVFFFFQSFRHTLDFLSPRFCLFFLFVSRFVHGRPYSGSSASAQAGRARPSVLGAHASRRVSLARVTSKIPAVAMAAAWCHGVIARGRGCDVCAPLSSLPT